MIYPGSTPEFRVLVKQNGAQELQVRYVHHTQGYTGKWEPIKVEYERNLSTAEA